MADCKEFAFVVPQCAPGTTLAVPAPDGCKLHIPLPENVLPGFKLFMAKGDDGNWAIVKAVRGALPDERAAVPASRPPPSTEWRSPEQLVSDLSAADVVKVRLDTTKGPVTLRIVPSWAPLGAQRFLQLVDEGFFVDIVIYRAIPNALLQFGVVQEGDPRHGKYPGLEDDPLVSVPFGEGMVSFAAAGPGTRKATLCLFLGDLRSQLGSKQPETPIGKVMTQSLGTMHGIYTGYGDIPQCGGKGPDPHRLEAEGTGYIRAEFPNCDRILNASRVP